MMATEAQVHFQFFHHLATAIEQQPTRNNTTFDTPWPEHSVDGGFADIVIPDHNRRPLVVVEAKRRIDGGYRRDIDPYSPAVIRQAHRYASALGADHFATFNGRVLVLFQTFESGIPLLQRKSRGYKITDLTSFASSFLDEVVAVREGTLRWDPVDTAFVERLSIFHERLRDHFLPVTEGPFAGQVKSWIEEQGWEVSESEGKQRFASQAAYLTMNKVVFHKILRDQGAYDLEPLEIPSGEDVQTHLAQAYKEVVERIDFEAVYEHDTVFDSVPLLPDAVLDLQEFTTELEAYDLSRIDDEIVGRIYERVIPWEERLALGQYYTPPEIVELIVRLTVRDPDNKVLDPACGSGSFLVAGYNRLKDLRKEAGKDASHKTLVSQVYGIDINRFPAHLTAINISIRDLGERTDRVNVEVHDFFHVNPGQQRLWAEQAGPGGSERARLTFPAKYEAIVANPPYIRQERIPNKSLCREHLEHPAFGTSPADLNEQCDIYCYFFTHSFEFLAPLGRMGFVTSNMWLAVQYGAGLQQFFLDHLKIVAIIQFWRRAFAGQLVPTCVTLLEDCPNSEERDSNLVKFIMIRRAIPLDHVVDLLEEKHEPSTVYSLDRARVLVLPQEELRNETKWHRFLCAPPVYWHLMGNEKLVPLGRPTGDSEEIANIAFGEKTGCNEFFVLTQNDVDDLGLSREYFQPFFGSPKQVGGIKASEPSPRLLLDVKELVDSLLLSDRRPSASIQREIAQAERIGRTEFRRYAIESRMSETTARRLRENEVRAIGLLKELGHEALYHYVLRGVQLGYYARPTLSSSPVWFARNKPKSGRLIARQNVRGRPHFPLADDPISVINTMYLIWPRDEEDTTVLAAYLNSSVGKLFFETHGRIQYGGMVRIFVEDLKDFPVLNPRSLSQDERERILVAFDALIARGEHEDEAWDALLELDRAILAPFGLEDRTEEVAETAKALSEARQEQKEYELPVEVEREETFRIPGATRLPGGAQTSLQMFD